MRTYRLWPCDKPLTPRKPRREYRLVIIDLHIKRRNSIGWRMLQALPWWFLFVARYNISSFIKRLNFSNCAEWARSALERCHERLKCARDFLAKTQFTRAVICRICTLADILLADILPHRRSTAVDIPLLAAGVLPWMCCYAYRHSADNLLSSHAALHMHIYALTVYHNAVAIMPTWCSHAVRMLPPRKNR